MAEVDFEDDNTIELDESADPSELAPWYKQVLQLPEKKRLEISEIALRRVKEAKPEAYNFIKKFNCHLVGLCPSIDYTLLKKSDGDLDVTFIHAFSMPTLLYWCADGGFGFFVNANLDYNDTVLNRVSGNKRDDSIKGFTG